MNIYLNGLENINLYPITLLFSRKRITENSITFDDFNEGQIPLTYHY
jgi:hypothetical protein